MPGVFTEGQPHVSARSVRLAEMLIASGASGIRTPLCPKCCRQVPLRATLHPAPHQPVSTVGYEASPCAGHCCPTPADRRTRRTLLDGDDERWSLIQRLIEDSDLDTRDRVAGLLVLPDSQLTSRLVTLRADCIAVDENDNCTTTLGTDPLNVPEPVAEFLADLVAERRGYAAGAIGINPWLFPGGRTGQHLSAQQMGVRLRCVGVSPQLARNTALIALAGELPAVKLAKLLGFSVKRAVTWNAEAGNTGFQTAPRWHRLRRSPRRCPQPRSAEHRPGITAVR
jgi:hypothetical protein